MCFGGGGWGGRGGRGGLCQMKDALADFVDLIITVPVLTNGLLLVFSPRSNSDSFLLTLCE